MSNTTELKPNYCFWCTAYGKDNAPTCYNCGNQIGTYPPEVAALIHRTQLESRLDEVKRLPDIPSFLYSVRNDRVKLAAAMMKAKDACMYVIGRESELQAALEKQA